MNADLFDWLQAEIDSVQTPRFHLVDGLPDARFREAIEEASYVVPTTYKLFVSRFGGAKLYRDAAHNSYRIGVFAAPRDATTPDGEKVLQLGFHDGAKVFCKLQGADAGSAIYELEAGYLERVSDTFANWLDESCARARNAIGPAAWRKILHGPEPFSLKEQDVLSARRAIEWKVIGLDSQGNHIIEVRNAAQRALPVLTIGARSRDGRLNGAVFLKIAHVRPGTTAQLHIDCYKNIVAPDQVDLFSLPDPGPEDRAFYRELASV